MMMRSWDLNNEIMQFGLHSTGMSPVTYQI